MSANETTLHPSMEVIFAAGLNVKVRLFCFIEYGMLIPTNKTKATYLSFVCACRKTLFHIRNGFGSSKYI